MKKIDLGQTIGILANIGVIAGIVFLAMELGQNNRLLRAEAAHNQLQNRLDNRQRVISDPEFAELWLKFLRDEPLNDVEELRITTHLEETILSWEYMFGQLVDGNVTRDRTAVANGYRSAIVRRPFGDRFTKVWESLRPSLNDDFVEFIENEVRPSIE